MQINHNVSAFSAWRNYTENVGNLRDSMTKLSSGLRIRHAGDDPAGLAMSERLRAQYRNTSAASKNTENMINYLQTADAWLQRVQDMMGRMGELAVMANDGTKSQLDRDNLQKEFQQMQSEIVRITSGATAAGKFNGLYLFRGQSGIPITTGDGVEAGNGITIQVGPDSNMVFNSEELNLTGTNFEVVGSYATYSYGSINLTLLGSGGGPRMVRWGSIICGAHISISTQSIAQSAVDLLNIGIDHVSSKRAVLGAQMKRMEQTLSGLRNYEENARATESRIRDVDVAHETTQFSKYQILVQVGSAMLAQANAMPNAVLQMIG